jgi:hypothetical protein
LKTSDIFQLVANKEFTQAQNKLYWAIGKFLNIPENIERKEAWISG